LGGVSFLPFSEHVYKQAPYQDIDKDTYDKLASEFPTVEWDKFDGYEVEDTTTGMQELSCVSGACELL